MEPEWSKRILVVAPHCDDETIGCGGLLARFAQCDRKVVIGATGDIFYEHAGRVVTAEERQSELHDSMSVVGLKREDCEVLYPDKESLMDTLPLADIVRRLDQAISDFRPTAVLFPAPSHHQDHRVMYEATVAALRPSPNTSYIKLTAIHEYPLGNAHMYDSLPGGKLYVDITDHIDAKIEALVCAESQVQRDSRHLIHPDNVRAFAKYRGSQCGVDYAECYHVLRILA